MSTIVIIVALLLVGLTLFVSVRPSTMARWITRIIPIVLMVSGVALIFLKQSGLGTMLVFGGVALLRRFRGVGPIKSSGSSQNTRSIVRSAALEMELDHETGAMNGVVLAGNFHGRELDAMDRKELLQLRIEVSDDGESLALLDAYLDRRLAGWREDAHADADAGQGSATGSGSMGKQEAYEVLGLAAGASIEEIRKAHRRLIKTAHPDSGGSTFLAAKINEAKDILLRGHS